jgi:hypothetical protein
MFVDLVLLFGRRFFNVVFGGFREVSDGATSSSGGSFIAGD